MAASLKAKLAALAFAVAGPSLAEQEEVTVVEIPAPPLILKKFAGDVFSLANFTLLIPLDDDGDGHADEVAMPLLRNFEDPAFFRLSRTGEGIVFRARRGDVLHEGETDPRCELREIDAKGALASWGTDDGRLHNLSIAYVFHAAPCNQTPVVAAGIYAGEREIFALRLVEDKALLSRVDLDPIVLEDPYEMGTVLELMILLDRGRVRLMRESVVVEEWPLEEKGLHLRAGCVLGLAPEATSDARAYGEVELRKLYLTHRSR